jgi:arylsulfatase A
MREQKGSNEMSEMVRPNIVYVLADDLGFGDLSCYGADKLETPNADQLARDGIRFEDAHAPSAVCTPTRYSVLTGRYSWRSRLKEGVFWGHSEPLIEEDRLTVPAYLKQHGYATACIGKWHLGLGWDKSDGQVNYASPIKGGPVKLGFEYFYGVSASLDMPPYCFIENERTVGIPSVEKAPKDFSQRGRNGLMVPGWQDEIVNQTLTEKAIDFIEGHVKNKEDDPFFLYFPVTGPHTPWSPATPFKDKSGIGPRGDLILELDWTIGQLTETLKRLGIWENTLFIFTSDNGPHPSPDEITIHGHQPAGDLRGQKADIWEGGHRVPFIASWPGTVEAGTVSSELICLTDLLGTCAEMMADPLPDHTAEDTISMLPALKGQASNRKLAVHHSITGMFSVRCGDWKLILGRGSGGFQKHQLDTTLIGIPTQGEYIRDNNPGQLYNIRNDKEEKYNLYVQNPDIVQTLTRELIDIINSGDNAY